MGFGAALGFALGGLFWLDATHFGTATPGGFRDPFGHASRPFLLYMLSGAAIGGGLVLVLDFLGLDLPLFPGGRRRESDVWARMEMAEAIARHRGGDRPAKPKAPKDPVWDEPVRNAFDGDADEEIPAWIPPPQAKRLVERLEAVRFRLFLVSIGGMTGLGGIATLFLYALSASALGDPDVGRPFLLLSLIPYAVLLWIGGNAWRFVALALTAITVSALIALPWP
jgi:hypothetical protein